MTNDTTRQPDGEGHDAGDNGPSANYSPTDRAFLLDLARQTIKEVVINRKLPRPNPTDIPEKFQVDRACFVTLRKNGELRGCIGEIFPSRPLYETVIHTAAHAATRDTRFQPAAPDELDKLNIEISILTVPQRLEFNSPEELLDKLRPNVDGVVLKLGMNQSTFLPQVWEHLPDKRQFLSRLCEKAHLPLDAWTDPRLKIQTYRVEAFEEPFARAL